MPKKFFIFLAAALAIFLVLLWIYFPSLSRYRELKIEEEKLTKRIREIDAQIKTLAEERNLLQTDVAYLEKVIREELGFVKPGEIVYELVTKKDRPNSKNLLPAVSATAATPSGITGSEKAATKTAPLNKPVKAGTSISKTKRSSASPTA